MRSVAANIRHRRSTGTVEPEFEAVRNEFDALLLADPGYSAQLAVRWHGRLIIDLVGGADLDADSLTGVFSGSKGAAALTIATLVDTGALDLDERVAAYWPEFAAAGKAEVVVRDLLSHKAGLAGVDGGLEEVEILDSSLGAAKLAAQYPLWRPGTAFGYHGITIGILAEELVRRITGETLQQRYERIIRAPRNIDVYLGLPAEEESRFRRVLPMRPTPAQAAEIAGRPVSADGLTALMYNSVNRDHTPGRDSFGPNERAVRAAGPSALGGIASARGLAALYAAALGDLGEPFLEESTVRAMSQQQSWGHDRTLDIDMCFAVMFMKPQPRMEFGSYRAFGHDGAGGAIGFADPMYGLSFGYIPMPMSYPGGADPKAIRLSQLVRRCVAGLD